MNNEEKQKLYKIVKESERWSKDKSLLFHISTVIGIAEKAFELGKQTQDEDDIVKEAEEAIKDLNEVYNLT